MVSEEKTRRSVLKSVGAGGTIATLPTMANAQTTESENPSLLESQIQPADIAQSEAQEAMNADVVSAISKEIESTENLKSDPNEAISVKIKTDNPQLNDKNPAILHLPLKPQDEIYHPDNGGLIMAMTADYEGKREVIAGLGITRKRLGGLFTRFLGGTDLVSVRVFGESTKGIGETQSFLDTSTDMEIEVPNGNKKNIQDIDDPTLYDWDVSCWGCTTIVSTACAGAATLGVGQCASAAISAGVFSFWAGGAAAAFCSYIVANASTLSCAAGTGVICASAGVCSFTE